LINIANPPIEVPERLPITLKQITVPIFRDAFLTKDAIIYIAKVLNKINSKYNDEEDWIE
jgi:hypothetical protein